MFYSLHKGLKIDSTGTSQTFLKENNDSDHIYLLASAWTMEIGPRTPKVIGQLMRITFLTQTWCDLDKSVALRQNTIKVSEPKQRDTVELGEIGQPGLRQGSCR